MSLWREPTNAEFWASLKEANRFFMGDSQLDRALLALTKLLERAGIPYAVCGAMALNRWGYRRLTTDLDILLTKEGLAQFKTRALGRGYVEKFPGSKGVRDTEHNVPVDFLIAGDYPGDGKPKPVRFPDPAQAGVRREELVLLPVPKLVELKLASGMSAAHRLKDLGDVVELIKAIKIERGLAEQLDPSVREKFIELWTAAQTVDPE